MFCKNINEYFSINFSEEILRLIFQHFSVNDLGFLLRVNQLFNFLVNRYIIGHNGNLRFLPCFSCKNYVRVQLPLENKKTNVFLPHRSISVDKEVSLYSYIIGNDPRISIDDLRRRINTGLDESNSIEGYSENVIIRLYKIERIMMVEKQSYFFLSSTSWGGVPNEVLEVLIL